MGKIQMSDEEYCDEYRSEYISTLQDDMVCLISFCVLLITLFVELYLGTDNVTIIRIVLLMAIFLSVPIIVYIGKRKFLKKVGLNDSQAKFRYELIKYKKLYMPLVQRLCRLNQHLILKQLDMLKASFRSSRGILTEFVFEREYTDKDYEDSIDQIKVMPIREKDIIMEILFQLAVLEDGIQDDEWELLTYIMDRVYLFHTMKRSVESYESFVKKYTPFRRSFADDANDKKTEESQRRLVPPHLKPYYAILGLDDDASDKDIKQAYHNLALQYHPDLLKNADRIKECEAKMMKINEAYEKIRG